MRYILIAIITLSYISCQKNPQSSSGKIKKSQLTKEWWRSYEDEKADKIMIFRPESYDFTASRGRQKWLIKENGNFTSIHLGPADRPIEIEGAWKIKREILIFDLEKKRKAFNIVSLSDTLLKVKEITPEDK